MYSIYIIQRYDILIRDKGTIKVVFVQIMQTVPLSICTWFFVYFKLDFSACVACKNQVWNRQKIKLKNQVKKSISWNRDLKKIKYR